MFAIQDSIWSCVSLANKFHGPTRPDKLDLFYSVIRGLAGGAMALGVAIVVVYFGGGMGSDAAVVVVVSGSGGSGCSCLF